MIPVTLQIRDRKSAVPHQHEIELEALPEVGAKIKFKRKTYKVGITHETPGPNPRTFIDIYEPKKKKAAKAKAGK